MNVFLAISQKVLVDEVDYIEFENETCNLEKVLTICNISQLSFYAISVLAQCTSIF